MMGEVSRNLLAFCCFCSSYLPLWIWGLESEREIGRRWLSNGQKEIDTQYNRGSNIVYLTFLSLPHLLADRIE